MKKLLITLTALIIPVFGLMPIFILKHSSPINPIPDNDTTVNIVKIKTELQDILNQRTKLKWTIDEIQTEVDKHHELDQIGGITVRRLEENNQERFITSSIHIDEVFAFFGNATKMNNFLYNGELDLTHEWNGDVTQNIIGIAKPLQTLLDTKVSRPWDITELQLAVEHMFLNGGIIVTPKTDDQSLFQEQNEEAFVFTGLGNDENKFMYENQITLIHWYEIQNSNINQLDNTTEHNKDDIWIGANLQNKVIKVFDLS